MGRIYYDASGKFLTSARERRKISRAKFLDHVSFIQKINELPPGEPVNSVFYERHPLI